MKKSQACKKLLGLLVSFVALLNIIGIGSSGRLGGTYAYAESIITPELAEIMSKADKNELIPIWVFRDVVELDKIAQLVYEETGKEKNIYENPRVFEEYITDAIIQELGLENPLRGTEARNDPLISSVIKDYFKGTDVSRETIKNIDGALFAHDSDDSIFSQEVQDIARNATAQLADAYFVERLAIVRRETTKTNEEFSKHIPDSREVLVANPYTGTHILRATPAEIKRYAALAEVSRVSFFDENVVVKPAWLDEALSPSQTGAAPVANSGYNGMDGNGRQIRIGVLENWSKYDATHAHLINADITYVPLGNQPNPPSWHATNVTSIIVGQPVTDLPGTLGVVPQAKVFQMSQYTAADITLGLIRLANDYSVKIINCSFEIGGGNGSYTAWDLEFDAFVRGTNITIVVAAANRDDTPKNMPSPSKALNVIAVGNADTVSTLSPFSMNPSSAVGQNGFLPNKPDVSAPGTGIRISNAEGSDYTNIGSGTSWSAPIVTGIVAQVMQMKPSFENNPQAIKSALIANAKSDRISTTGNPTAGNNHLREKSGAGLVWSSTNVLTLDWFSGTITTAVNTNVLSQNLVAGQKVKYVLAFGKNHTRSIDSYSDMDNLDISLVHTSSGVVVGVSDSTRNNVEIIVSTIHTTGTYHIQITRTGSISPVNGIPYAISKVSVS